MTNLQEKAHNYALAKCGGLIKQGTKGMIYSGAYNEYMKQMTDTLVEKLYLNNLNVKAAQQIITEKKKLIEDTNISTQEIIVDNPEIKHLIINKLNEGIEKFGLNDNKEDKQYNESESSWSSVSSDGEYKSGENVIKTKNTNGKFNPAEDEWEISDIEYKDNKYKVTVENIKGRKFLNPFMWEPDYYYTDWFEI